MKYLIFLASLLLILALGISDALAQTPVFNSTVLKIKEDDDGKLIILKNVKQVLYLKYTEKNFDSVFSALDNSLSFGSNVKILTDGKLNIVGAE